MVRLNQREVELLGVTRDLFLKGSPEWRVAKYAHERHLTQQQLANFLNKIGCLLGPVRSRIENHFKDIEQKGCFDESVKIGDDLNMWLRSLDKVQINDA